MSFRNGGIIGKKAIISNLGPPANASGAWSMNDQSIAVLEGDWPPLYYPPTAPTSVSAVANGFTAADVTYSGEITYGDSPTFTATSSPGGLTGTGASPITVSGLTSGTSYTFTVTVDDAGGSATSDPSAPITLPLPVDPNFASVSLLVDGNGNLEDESNNNHPLINFGTTTSTSIKKFGSGSVNFGTTDDNGSFSRQDADFQFGTGDFTVEAWVYQTTSQSLAGITSSVDEGNFQTDSGFLFALYQGKLTYAFKDSVTDMNANSSNYTLPTNQWVHVAVSRNSGSMRIFADGVQKGSTKTNNGNASGTDFHVGRLLQDFSSRFLWAGYMDEIRVTKGVGRYTANFTPPASEFPRSS